MKFRIESQTKKDMSHMELLGFVETDKDGNLSADVNIVDLAQISHKAGYPLKVDFNDKTGYVMTILDRA